MIFIGYAQGAKGTLQVSLHLSDSTMWFACSICVVFSCRYWNCRVLSIGCKNVLL